MTTDRIAAIREAVTALRKITEQVPNYGMAHAIDLMKDFDLVYENLAHLDALEKERENITLDDVRGWADGVLAALGTELKNRVTEEECIIAAAIEAATIAGCKQEGDGDE